MLAAANAAGYDAEIDSPTNSPVRKIVRDYIAKQNPQTLPALQRFLRDAHLKRAKTLARLGDHVRAIAEVHALVNAPATDGETSCCNRRP